MPGEDRQVDARIVYWGIHGAGVTTNLRTIHARLRADHRGELRRVPTRLDPSTSYTMLPIELGQVGGARTRLQIIGVPTGPDQVAHRKQLLDRADGLVLVLDCQPSRLDENLASYDELRRSLSAYGRELSTLPVVVQYNKRDLAQSFDIESLHRKLDLRDSAVFEAVAREGTGVLQTLTTVSKRVVRVLSRRDTRAAALAPSPADPEREPVREPEQQLETQERTGVQAGARPAADGGLSLEDAILLGGEDADQQSQISLLATQHALDRPWSELEKEATADGGFRLDEEVRIVGLGAATIAGDRSVRVPITLANPSGERARLSLTISLDPLLDSES